MLVDSQVTAAFTLAAQKLQADLRGKCEPVFGLALPDC